MKKIACLGSEAFTLGFQLSGIRIVLKPGQDLLDTVKEIKQNKDIGIVIIQEELLNSLDGHDRAAVEDDVNPVFIPLSTKTESDALRKLILKSIGVDLWKQ